MKTTTEDTAELVTTQSQLEAAIELALKQSRVAVDLESNGFYRYPERVCLVQLAVGPSVYLIDPLALEDPSSLGELLADAAVEKVFHSADYDIRSLDRDWRFPVRGLFDTSIAAAFVGAERLGLAAVLKEYLDVEVNKSKRLQRADWTRRPISDELLRYAAEDVRHLARLRTLLYDRLDSLGRTEWVREETQRLAAVRHSPPDAEWSFLSVKGSGELDERGTAVLRAVHGFRESEALRRDRPPFKVFSDAVVVALASRPRSDLSQVKGIGSYGRGSGSSGVRRAIREGLRAPPIRRPRRRSSGGVRLSAAERKEARRRLRLLKEWRLEQAGRLGLDQGLVWPAVSLGRLSTGQVRLGDELESGEVRRWQRRELGESLRDFMQRLQSGPTGGSGG